MSAKDSSNGLGLIVFSSDFNRLHYALSMAAAAVAVNRPVTLFFTMEGLRALGAGRTKNQPGWHDLPVMEAAGQSAMSAAELDTAFGNRGVAQFEELLTSSVALGARLMVCEMGLRALGLEEADLRDDLPLTVTGLVSFYRETEGRRLLFI